MKEEKLLFALRMVEGKHVSGGEWSMIYYRLAVICITCSATRANRLLMAFNDIESNNLSVLRKSCIKYFFFAGGGFEVDKGNWQRFSRLSVHDVSHLVTPLCVG